MKRFVLILIATASLAVMAAQASSNHSSFGRLPTPGRAIFSVNSAEATFQDIFSAGPGIPLFGATASAPGSDRGTALPGFFFAKETGGEESLTKEAKTDTVLNDEEEEEEGEEGEEEEEEGEGWDRIWDAPKLA